MNSATFLLLYPQFQTVDSDQLDAVLAAEDLGTPTSIPDAMREEVVGLRAADRLARSPMSTNQHLDNPEHVTIYRARLKELYAMIAFGHRTSFAGCP